MLVGNGTVRVEIGKAWYELREWLGWYAARQVREAKYRLVMPELEEGEKFDPGQVQVRMDRPGGDLARLQARLAAWSHEEPITAETVKRICPAHAEALLARIAELEQAEGALEMGEREKK